MYLQNKAFIFYGGLFPMGFLCWLAGGWMLSQHVLYVALCDESILHSCTLFVCDHIVVFGLLMIWHDLFYVKSCKILIFFKWKFLKLKHNWIILFKIKKLLEKKLIDLNFCKIFYCKWKITVGWSPIDSADDLIGFSSFTAVMRILCELALVIVCGLENCNSCSFLNYLFG